MKVSKIEQLRQRLRKGPATASQLEAVISNGRAGALLKYDLEKGLVLFKKESGEFGVYSIAADGGNYELSK